MTAATVRFPNVIQQWWWSGPRVQSDLSVASVTLHVGFSLACRLLARCPLLPLLSIILDLAKLPASPHHSQAGCHVRLLLLHGPYRSLSVPLLDLYCFDGHLQGPTSSLHTLLVLSYCCLKCVKCGLFLAGIVVGVVCPTGQPPCTISQLLGRLILPSF